MTDAAAIQGDYTDLRFVKGRKVAVIHVEIPIESASAFVKAFGTPSPATGVPVALARLQDSELKQQLKASVEHEKKKWADMPRSQQAAIACGNAEFCAWLDYTLSFDDECPADTIRRECGVGSRRDLDTNPSAARRWDEIYSQYELEKRGART